MMDSIGSFTILYWDWKASPIEIIDDVLKVLNATFVPIHAQEIATDSDSYCVIMGPAPLTPEAAQEVYANWLVLIGGE